MARVSASILSFWFEAKKNKESTESMVKRINIALQQKKNEFQILHYDIMDGVFVEAKTFSPAVVRKIKSPCKREVHFMVVNYKKYLADYLLLADMFIFHDEVLKNDFAKTIETLHKQKKFVGLSINSDTSLEELKYLEKVDLVMLMSIYPGKPGQKFIETTIRKIKKLAEIRKKNNYKFVIEVDGGINDVTGKRCSDAGADVLVIGSWLFKGY